MNEDEIKTINLLASSWNQFVKLSNIDQDDLTDFRKAIHDAQRIVMSREARRNNKKLFNQ